MTEKTLAEVIENARLNEPCTEHEMRMALTAIKGCLSLTVMDLAKWANKDIKPDILKLMAKNKWELWQKALHTPLETFVSPEMDYRNQDKKKHKELAEKIVKLAMKDQE